MIWSIWYLLFITLFAAYWRRRRRMQQIICMQMKRKNRKEINIMNELMKKFIGQDVIIFTVSNSFSGTLTGIEDGWAEIETQNGSEIVNLAYISIIKEYPAKKKGKKSSVKALFEE